MLWAVSHFSHVSLFATPCQALLSMGFSRQEFWSGLPCPHPGDLPDSGMEPASYVSCVVRQVLYHQRHLGSPTWHMNKLSSSMHRHVKEESPGTFVCSWLHHLQPVAIFQTLCTSDWLSIRCRLSSRTRQNNFDELKVSIHGSKNCFSRHSVLVT